MFENFIEQYEYSFLNNVINDFTYQSDDIILGNSFDDLVNFFYENHKLTEVNINPVPDCVWEENKSLYGGYTFTKKYYIIGGGKMLNYYGSNLTKILSCHIRPFLQKDFETGTEWIEFTNTFSLEEVEDALSSDESRIQFENKSFSSEIGAFFSNVNYLNNSIKSINAKILNCVKNELTNAISIVSRKIEIRNKLKIKTMPIVNITNKKIDLSVVEKKKNIIPSICEPYYYISNQDYDLIIQIIDNCMIQYERTPKSFEDLGEEDIRNLILGAVNANFEFKGTAESFSNNGHTDIMIETNNKAAFIAECKLWNGAEYISKGIDQLLGYTTYKDSKLALLVFNKANKDFSNVLTEMDNLIKHSPKLIKIISKRENKWECFFKSKHSGTVRITFIVANYHYEK